MTTRYKCNKCGRVIDEEKKPILFGHLDCAKCGGRFKETDSSESLSEGDPKKQDSKKDSEEESYEDDESLEEPEEEETSDEEEEDEPEEEKEGYKYSIFDDKSFNVDRKN